VSPITKLNNALITELIMLIENHPLGL